MGYKRGMDMKPSLAAVTLAKTSEGLRLTAYPDPATGLAPWTVGYGSTMGVKEGDVITLDQAEARLDRDLLNAASVVNKAVTVPLTQGQFDALTDFVFNVGPGRKDVKDGFVVLKSGKPSTMLCKLNAGDYAGAADEFPKWVNGNGKPMAGLITRRAKERALFEGKSA